MNKSWMYRVGWLCLLLSNSVLAQSPDGLSREFAADDDIKYFELTSLGTLFVSTTQSSMAVPPLLTTQAIWTSRSLRDCKSKPSPTGGTASVVCKFNSLEDGTLSMDSASHLAYFRHKNGFGVLNLETGEDWLRTTTSPNDTLDARIVDQRALITSLTESSKAANIAVVDLDTGKEFWSLELPFVRGLRVDWEEGWWSKSHYREEILVLDAGDPSLGYPLLLAGEMADGRIAIAAIDRDSGKQLWLQDNVPQKLEKPKDQLKRMRVDNYLRSSRTYRVGHESVLISPAVHAPGGEPFALNRRTGEILWKAKSLYKEHSMCALCSFAERDTLYTLHEKFITALSASDGSVKWTRPSVSESFLPFLMQTSHGILVGCSLDGRVCNKEIELIDSASGKPKWSAPFAFGENVPGASIVDPSGDTLLFAADGKLRSLDLQSGKVIDIGDLNFKFGETPTGIMVNADIVVVTSNQNVASFRKSGGAIFVKSLEAPKTGFLEAFGKSLAVGAINTLAYTAAAKQAGQQAGQNAYLNALSRNSRTGTGIGTAMYTTFHPGIVERYSQSLSAVDHNFIYTSEPDALGQEGYSLVQLRNTDGVEISRAWVGERNPDMVVDPILPIVYLRREDKRIAAIPFLKSK